jgi:hypothetical protein
VYRTVETLRVGQGVLLGGKLKTCLDFSLPLYHPAKKRNGARETLSTRRARKAAGGMKAEGGGGE